MEEQGGEDASAVAGPHPSRPPGDENPPSSPLSLLPEVDEVGLPHCDEAECAGEAGYCSMPQGSSSSSASPLSGSDAGVLEPAALEPAPDAISAGDVDAVDGEPAWVVAEEADDTPIPQCEQATGHGEAQVWMPQGFPASSPSRSDRGVEEVVTFEPDAEDTAGADDDPMKEETLRMAVEVAENILIPQWQQRNDDMQEKMLMSQGSPAVSPSGSDGGVPKFAALETDTIATTAGDVDAAEEAVLKMDVESVPISQWQKGKDGAQEQVLMPHGSPVVCPSGSDGGLLKIAAFEIDTVAATAGNADAVEDAVLKMDVDNAPTPQRQQGKDGVQEEVLMPQGSPAVSPSGSDCGLVKYAIFETDTTATTAGDDDAVEEAVSKMNVDSGPITADKQVEDCGVADICKQEEDCGEADISMPKSSPSLSPSDSGGGHEKVEACKPDTVATSGDDDAVKEEVAMADADKFDNMPLTLCELMEDAGEAEISMPQGSLSEFPSGSDRAENIAAIEPDTATMSHGSADAMDDESAQMDVEADETPVVVRRGGGRRKRGRPAKTQAARTPSRRKEEEEVCFICFDGGDLVVCDRRGCPKVYHPSCVNRDEAFFRAKGRWSCGWHICSSCERSAHYMCFTCTHSLCRGCIKEAGFFCVRGTKGFCETCMSTVMLIETNEHGNEKMIGVDFDDSSSFEYLFKDYWLSLKAKLSLTLEELTGAKNPMKRSDVATGNEESSDDLHNANEEKVASSDSSSERKEESISSRRKVRKRSKNTVNEEGSVKEVENAGTSVSRDIAWASDELLEFVAHMRNGDRSALSQFDVQGLLLDYIKRNNLRDPRRKSQIICDARLENLFGKPRVGHFEMLKLLESHFFMKEVSPLDTEDKQGGVVDPDPVQIDAKGNNDASTKITPDKRRKTRRKVGEKELLTNLDDFAAIDVHNISLMYLRRNLMEELVDDISFDEKVIGSFVRIRISGVGQRQDMYRLVQVVGTGKAAERYKSGKKTTDITLEILNLNKKEAITIDIISNQEFTEEECKRLRQSIKCGFICRLTVGDVQDKARSLQAVKVNDWLESEKLRLGHLRDRASEKGRRKELRECIEKLQLLNTPEEHNRRLNEVPEIHTDPHMDPDYESAEEEEESDMRKQDYYDRSRGSSFLRNGREVKSPGKGGSTLSDNWSISRKNSNTWESNRSALTEGASIADSSAGRGVNTTEFSLNLANDVCQASSSEAPKNHVTTSVSDANLYNEKQHITRPEQSSDGLQGNQKASLTSGLAAMANTSESDKIWHYQDPSGKIQGPFSMTQLRKWNTTGYFPPNLRIWKTSEKQEDSLLLSDALVGKLQKDLPEWEPHHNSTSQSMVVSPTVFGAGTNSEGVWRGSDDSALSNSKQNAQKWNIGQNEKWTTRPSSWSSQKREISSRDRILPKDTNAKIGQAQGQNSPRPISSHDGNQPQAPPYQAIGSQVSSSGTSDAYKDCGSVWSANKPFVSQTSGQHYENPHANWSSTSQQLSSSTYKIPPVNDSSHQWRNDSSNVPIPTPQPSRKGWSASEDSLHKHLPSSASVQDTALGCATTMRGGEEPESSFTINEPSRSTSNSFRELGSSSAQYVLDQTVISDGGKSVPSASLSAPNTVFLGQTIALTQHPDEVDALGNFQKKNSELESLAASVNQTASKLPVRDEMNQPSNVTDFSGPSSSQFGAGLCSNQSVEMKIALTHEQAASEILSSEYNQPASSHLDGIQDSLFVSHDQHDPGQDLLRTHERSSDESKRTSDGSGPNNDSVACAQIGPSVSPACFQPERFSFRLETGVLSEDLREKTLVTEVENLSPAVSSKILQADSDKNPGGLAGSLDKQMYQTSTVSYPGSNLMPERVSCEAPNPSTCPSDAPTNLFVQSDDLESISAHRYASSNTEPYISGPEPKHSASYEVPTHMNSSNKSMPFAPHMTPYGFNCVTDSTTVNNESVQLLPSDGSNPLLSSQFGANATLVPVQPTQMGFGTGSNVQNTSFPVAPQNSNPNSGPAQGTGNMSWAPAPQGNTNVGWGMVAQGNMNMSWGQPAQTIANLNMGLGAQSQVNTMNSSWVAPLQGNTNMNVAWVNPAMGTNQTSGWGGQLQGNFAVNPVWTMLLQGQTNPSPGWVAPAPTNANPNWESPAQGTMNMNAAWGPGQGNINPSLNPSAGNPQSLGSQPPQSGDRRSGQGENLRGNDPGHTNRRLSWNRMQSGGGSSLPPRGQTGICRFHEMGHCKKGASCNYFHP